MVGSGQSFTTCKHLIYCLHAPLQFCLFFGQMIELLQRAARKFIISLTQAFVNVGSGALYGIGMIYAYAFV